MQHAPPSLPHDPADAPQLSALPATGSSSTTGDDGAATSGHVGGGPGEDASTNSAEGVSSEGQDVDVGTAAEDEAGTARGAAEDDAAARGGDASAEPGQQGIAPPPPQDQREGASQDDGAALQEPSATSVAAPALDEDAGSGPAPTTTTTETSSTRDAAPATADPVQSRTEADSTTAIGDGPALEQPTPSNPARKTSSLLSPSPAPPSLSITGDDNTPTAPPAAASPTPTSSPLGAVPAATSTATATAAARTASPALSASPGPGTTSPASERPAPTKKFQSSLAVNKKFLEKAGEKAKPEVKPVIARVATSPAPTPASSSHPRLLAGKLSSGPSLSLGQTGTSSTSSSPGAGGGGGSGTASGWGLKKSTTPTPGATSAASGAQSAAGPGGSKPAGGPVWGTPAAAAANGAAASGAPNAQPSSSFAGAHQAQQTYTPGGMRGAQFGRGRGGSGPGGWGGVRDLAMDFPTAAEAANAQEARQKALAEQALAREKASQARAAAAAAHNAHLLEELDAFRGVHLDPNAAHWDEADDDDFLDTTIEFADGTQYKLDTAPPTPAAEEELREPGPRELALRERPLAPGEVVEPPKREERFRDDYDRSWPRRPSRSGGESRTLFNDRLGKLEPAGSSASAAAHAPARHGGTAEPTGILRSGSSSAAAGPSDVPPHLALGGHVPPPTSGRRPSITSPHAPLHPAARRESVHEPAPAPARAPAWGGAGQRRPSTSHALAGGPTSLGAQDHQLPPHLAARAAAQAPPLSPPRAARRPSVPAAAAVPPVSPTRASAAPSAPGLAATSSKSAGESASTAAEAAAASTSTSEPAGPPPPTIEELHAREMHAAAERARKRREEEEQKRLEQQERARKKAQELEEKMKAAEEAKLQEKRDKEEEAARARAQTAKDRRPSAAAGPGAGAGVGAQAPLAPADKATSWRAAAKPLPPPAAAASAAAAVAKGPSAGPSAKTQLRQPPPAATTASSSSSAPATARPTSILPRPSVPAAAPAGQPPTQLSAWRRTSASAAGAPAAGSSARAPVRQLPPHLAAQAEAKAAAAAAAPKAAAPSPPSQPAAEATAAASEPPARPSTPPPPSLPPQSPPAATSPPLSPSQDRKRQEQAAKHGYKMPAVSQIDDLMSRIKGVMGQPSAEEAAAADTPVPPKENLPAEGVANRAAKDKAPAAEESVSVPPVEVPTVKLPPRTRASKAAARAAMLAAHAAASASYGAQPPPLGSLPTPSEPRGRGRGRADVLRAARQAVPVPAFESREPVLPHHSSRIARSHSPPPAWRQYPIRLASQPPRRPVAARVLKNFTNPGFPKPLYPFSWEPVLKDVNPRRLNRDDMLLPKKYDKNGAPIFIVVLPRQPFAARGVQPEPEERPEIVVSISKVALVRQAAPEPPMAPITFEPAQPVPEGEIVDAGFAPFSDGGAHVSGTRSKDMQAGAKPGAPPDQALFSLGLKRQEATFTGALNGEKIEATPRKETTAPGRDARGSGKAPTSPPFKPQGISQVSASPSAAAPWASKALAYSALDPTASSVWSAAPDEGSVHARAIAASNLPENSLQGIVDEDPSEALPSSLAELKSEDGHSSADHKELPKPAALPRDEAKLRAAAPSFSSFLHESAATVDPSVSPVMAATSRHAQHHAYPGFPAQDVPQPSPSPLSAYAASQSFSPHLYPQMQARPHVHQPQPSPQHGMYPPYSGPSASPFAQQPIHQAYSTSPYVATSPVPPTLGYPSPYRESASPAVPHGITNPALLASYSSYGLQPQMAGPGATGRGYGAVGAVGGPAGPGPIGRPPHQQQGGASSNALYGRIAPAPSSYHVGGGGPGQYSSPFQPQQHHLHQQPQHSARQGAPYRADSYGSSSDGRTHAMSQHHGSGVSAGFGPPPPGATTMASPVIVPQQLPPVPHFSPGHPGHHVALGSSPGSHGQGMGMGVGFGGVGGGGYGRGLGNGQQGGYGGCSQVRPGVGGGPLGRPPQAGSARW